MLRVVCACNKYLEDDSLILGVRHFDEIMQAQIKTRNLKIGSQYYIQGFVDNKKNFLTREEALPIAKAAEQLVRKTHPLDQLFSEDLY